MGNGTFGDVWKGGWVNLMDSSATPPLVAIKIIRPYKSTGNDRAIRDKAIRVSEVFLPSAKDNLKVEL